MTNNHSEERQKMYKEYQAYISEQNARGELHITFEAYKKQEEHKNFVARLNEIAGMVELGENFEIIVEQDREIPNGRMYFQIKFYRPDAFTKVMEWGYGGKAYLSPHATRNELVQTLFGLYKSFWEHEARESFLYRGRRVFGPHMDVDEVWTVARKVDVRSAQHKEDHGGRND